MQSESLTVPKIRYHSKFNEYCDPTWYSKIITKGRAIASRTSAVCKEARNEVHMEKMTRESAAIRRFGQCEKDAIYVLVVYPL
jgi:hypothetical protein